MNILAHLNFDERLQKVSDLLHECAAALRNLIPSAEGSIEKAHYKSLEFQLLFFAHCQEGDLPVPPEVLREKYFDLLLLQAQMTRTRFLELAAEERKQHDPSKGNRIDGRNLKKLFKPRRGRKGLAEDWREAGRIVLSQKLGLEYDEILKFIFFPDAQ